MRGGLRIMGKVLHLIFPTFSEWETGIATSVVGQTHEVVHVGVEGAVVRSESRLRCLPDLTVNSVNPDEYAGIIIPGGLDMVPVAEAPDLYALVRTLYRAGKSVAAICGGPLVLARAGLLADLDYTACFDPEQRAILQMPEEHYRDLPLVQSGRVLTARGWAYVDFALAAGDLFGVYRDKGHARAVAAYYKRKK